jgi:hypothetical protein
MKVFLHIGPHKTGTTALQRSLYQHAQSGQCGYFYPEPSLVAELAHAQLAWRFLGLAGCERFPEILLRKVAAAEKAGFAKVVFSSEEFARAMFVAGGFGSFAPLCAQVECELVITLSPLTSRVLPELQEAVKHGGAFDPATVADLERLCETRPGLRPDFLDAAIHGINAARASVILVDKRDPEKIYRDMSTILGETLPIPAAPVVNASAPAMKTVWHSAFNQRFSHVPWETGRAVADAAFAAAVREYGPIADLAPPALPVGFATHLAAVWESQLRFLDEMGATGRLRCL